MTILVTGGAGFIGSNFIHDWFLENNELIINIDKLSYAANIDNLAMNSPYTKFEDTTDKLLNLLGRKT